MRRRSTAQAFTQNADHKCTFVSLNSPVVVVPSQPVDTPQAITFTGLEPNTLYNFYDLLGSSFTEFYLLYLSQGVSDENGVLTVWYRPAKTDVFATKYVRCIDPAVTGEPVVLTTAPATTAVTTSAPISTIKGDANGDFVVDVSDAVLVARFCAEDSGADITRQGILNADVNHSGSPDPDDTILILRYIAKLITSLN